MWKIPKIWEGGEVWIVGGGPSITEQFNIPEKVVKGVIEGSIPPSAYSPYMSAIHDKHVIGINMSYKLGDWIDIVFFGDLGFFLREKKNLAEFKGLKVSCHPGCEKYNWVKFLNRDETHRRGISTKPSMVAWNGNSGAAAVSLAIHLGAKKIILVGFDMKLNDAGAQHWHDLYRRLEYLKTAKNPALPFDRHLIGFFDMANDAKRLGVTILNASPNSALTVFEKVTVKELLS